jgi:hypothetical protein
MRTLSIRSNLFFVIVIKLLYLLKSSQAARCVRRFFVRQARDLKKGILLYNAELKMCYIGFLSYLNSFEFNRLVYMVE